MASPKSLLRLRVLWLWKSATGKRCWRLNLGLASSSVTEEVGVVFPRETRPAGARGPTQRVGSGTCTRARTLTCSLPTPVKLSPSISVCLIDCFPVSRWTGTSLQNTSHSRFLPRRLPLPTLTHLLHGGESLSLSPPLPCLHPLHFSAPHLHYILSLFSSVSVWKSYGTC